MHRRPLLELLARYRERHPDEPGARRTEAFVLRHPDCFLRSCAPGHVTASAWIVSSDGAHALLAHHRKLGRWLQLGGHADGDPCVHAVALREAREESGMEAFALLPGPEAGLLDVDVHRIPERPGEPAHWHYDVRFLLRAAPGQSPRASRESHAVRWFPRGALARHVTEESLLRLEAKARRLGF